MNSEIYIQFPELPLDISIIYKLLVGHTEVIYLEKDILVSHVRISGVESDRPLLSSFNSGKVW